MQIQFEFICYFQKYHLSRCHMSGPERVNFSPCIQRMIALGFSILRWTICLMESFGVWRHTLRLSLQEVRNKISIYISTIYMYVHVDTHTHTHHIYIYNTYIYTHTYIYIYYIYYIYNIYILYIYIYIYILYIYLYICIFFDIFALSWWNNQIFKRILEKFLQCGQVN